MAARKILLIQTAFIGDVVLSTPAIRAIKHHFPQDSLSVLVKPEARSILENNPAIDQVLVIDKKGQHRGYLGMRQMQKSIHKQGFDLLLSPHQSHRTSILALQSRIPRRVGYQSAAWSGLAYHIRLMRDPQKPEIERLLEFVDQALDCNSSQLSRQPEIQINHETQLEAQAFLNDLGVHKPILLAPSSVWPTKRWTSEGFAGLCLQLVRKYHRPILLVGSAADKQIAQDVVYLLQKIYPADVARQVFNICGQTSLLLLYAIMQKSSLLVSNDSAPVHFAAAARIPIVAIFGPTTPELGYAPIMPNSRVAQLNELVCRPCGTHGAHNCPLEHFECMRGLSAEQVMIQVAEVWGI